MKTIGVVIGSTDEGIEPKYFKQKKASLKFLEEYGYTLPHIPFDTAIFAEIKHQSKKMNVIPLFGDDYLSLDECTTSYFSNNISSNTSNTSINLVK